MGSRPCRGTPLVVFAFFALVLSVAAGTLALAQDASPNVLAGRSPWRAQGVRRAAALTDGRLNAEGDDWKTSLTTSFEDTRAFVVYDLGEPRDLSAVVLQGDHGDVYALEGSSDGVQFHELWRARATREPGLRTRSSAELHARARFVRLRPSAGDGFFSISELQLFSQTPAVFPPAAEPHAGRSLDERLRDRTLAFGMSLLLPLFLLRRSSRLGWVIASGVLPAIALYQFASAVYDAWPAEQRAVSLVRGTIGAVAALAVARSAFAPRGWAAHRASVMVVLGLCAALAPIAFYNLGQPQFYSQSRGEWTFAHYLDLRQYYPTAKYFSELGYRRMYDADLAAYLEDHPEVSFASIQGRAVRDLETLDVVTVGDRAEAIANIKRRFSSARWNEYRRDAAWFRDTMGPREYFDTLRDFGGNATPVWIAMAHVLFTWTAPSNQTFTLTGMIDLLLLAAMFAAVQRSFGWFAMFVALVVFGANDFVMYGTNWSGATLRHDWLAYTGLGLCALRRERPLLAGALLGLATMIRAFPALTFAGVAMPMLWRVLEGSWQRRSPPSLRELWDSERATVYVALGALGAAVVAGLLSLCIVPASAWVDWLAKVGQLESGPHPAVVSLRNFIAGWENQAHFLQHRRVVYWGALALFCALAGVCARGKRPEQGAVLGLMLLPIVFYPANYYLHVVCLFPLLASLPEGQPTVTDAAGWVIWLGLCAAQYFTVLVTDLTLHFYLASALLLAASFALLSLGVRENLLLLSAREDS